MKSFILFLFLMLVNIGLRAQELLLPKQNYLGFGIGINIERINDENFSALPQKGSIIEYSLFYERYQTDIFKINLAYGGGELLSGTRDQFESTRYYGRIGVSYFKGISSLESATKIYVGGSYQLEVLYLDWFDLDAFSYMASNGFSIGGAIVREIDAQSSIETSVTIPILQLLSRPPYAGIDENIIENQDQPVKIILDGSLSSINTYRAINWNINYRRTLFQDIALKLDYTLQLQKVDDVNRFNRKSNMFSTSLLYQF